MVFEIGNPQEHNQSEEEDQIESGIIGYRH
jgi:hypothetical protein